MSPDPRSVLALVLAVIASGCDCGASHSRDDAGDDDRPCVPCTEVTLSWGYSGGRACTRDRSFLDDCRSYRHERTPEACMVMRSECTAELAACGMGDGPDLAEIQSVVAHRDLRDALDDAPVLYGADSRPF